MTRTLRYLLLFVFTGLFGSAAAQEISGKVLDEKKQPLSSAVVQVYQGGILKGGDATDYDGNYTVKPLDPGNYDILVHYPSYDSIQITNVVVAPGERTTQNFTMKVHAIAYKGKAIEVIAYRKPLIDQDKPTSSILTSQEIAVIPTTQVTDLVALTPGVYQSQRGQDLNIGGARTSGTLYIIDGVQVQGTIGIDMAQGSVDQVEVITSGLPANYGDLSGSVVNITSRGVSQKLTGDVRVQHSIDGYNNNMVNFTLAGPLYKKKIQSGDRIIKKPVLGFSISGDVYYDNDRYPSYFEDYTASPSVLKALQEKPLTIISDNSGNPVYNYSSDYITQSQLVQTKIPPNNLTQEYRLNGKLNYQLTDNISLTAGGMVDDKIQDYYSLGQGNYNRTYQIFAPGATPTETTLAGRGYIKFSQKFGTPGDTAARNSKISNAYYTIQADYQKTYISIEDPNFKHNIFDYSYIGTFNETRTKTYLPGQLDSASGRTATVLTGTTSNGITYNPSTSLNPILSNYTSEYYDYNAKNNIALPTQLTQIQAKNALINGDEPQSTYGLFASPGASQYFYYVSNSNQYALTVDASFDLLVGKVKHNIQFGLYYQQRVEESYTLYSNIGTTASLWQLMRGLVSSYDNGNLVLDKQNPIFIVNGKQYTLPQVNAGQVIPGPTDTIIYNYKNIGSGTSSNQGTPFDQALRKKLGITNPDSSINIDALSPSTFSLGMFTADELLNGGTSFAQYYGYTYTGGTQAGNVNFNDFWTAKDANGNYTRPIAAFSPNYIAGYLLDKFTYKDVHFNLGVRVDRYDANTEVLIDPYSEYPEKTVSQVGGAANILNGGKTPSNIGGNYVVYVDNNSSTSPEIIGYRSGNNWYDPYGNLIENPASLTQYSGGRPPQPLLVNPNSHITDTNFNPNLSFTNYTPQVNVQPRLQFSFPISDVADFYAHYDIYSQRPYPSAYGVATPYTYYYLSQNANSIIPNANLLPEQTIDYEVGFQQKLSDHSKISLSAFYKERKDQVTVVPYLYAWPASYFTYGNRDFSTTKGTTLNYDLRATNHLRLNISYTLQFAEGTGSTPLSTNSGGNGQVSSSGLLASFIAAGEPDLRYVTPLNYDSRHNIVGTIEYRYDEGEGPLVGGKNILQNAGIDIIPSVRSGEPYTAYSSPVGNTVIGGINGTRLPWHYNVNLNVDKSFALNNSKKHNNPVEGIKPKRPLYLKAILQVNNLLNTEDIISVYGYTGKPNDNGYLASPYGQQFVPQQVNPASYSLLYSTAYNNPANYNYARTITFALEFNF